MITAVIDRLEGDRAVLLCGEAEEQVIFPAALLPAGVQEGDYLSLEISPDQQVTEAARSRAADLMRELQGGD